MTATHRRHLPFGAELIAPDRARFRLWGPSCSAVSLLLDERAPIAMQRDADGWFALDAACVAGTRYRFGVTMAESGETITVPDPASRAQDGGVHGASIVVDPHAYRWQHDAWRGRPWHEAVFYELHVGIAGGFAGVGQRLPALAALGVTAIELMPVGEFPGPRNWGYDGVLPFASASAYGTPDELKALIDSAHGLGLMVFLDVVYNHFGPEGNFVGVYADDFFRDDIATPWGRAIDFRRPGVRDFYCENALYWLMEYRFDGLRLDATHSIVPQDWLFDLASCVRDTVDPPRHVHLVLEHEGNAAHLLTRGDPLGFPYAAQWNDDGHHALHVLLTGETDGYYIDYASAPADKLARCLAEGFIYQGQPSVFRGGQSRGEPSKDLPTTAFVLFLQNHDQIGNRAFGERLTTLADPHALFAASALVLLCPQIPLLFMGEQWGATEPFLYFASYSDVALAEAVRLGRRNEFADKVADAIPDPNDPSSFARSVPIASRSRAAKRWLLHTRALLATRHAHIIPRLVGTRSLGAEGVGPAAVVARWHMGDGAVLTIASNLAASEVSIAPHRFPLRGDVLFATGGTDPSTHRESLPAHTTWALLGSAA